MAHHESPYKRHTPKGVRISRRVCDNRSFRKSGRHRVNGPPPAPGNEVLMLSESTCRIALYGREGIVAHSLVDPEDYERFHAWRWHLKNGYAAYRSQKGGNKNAVYTRTYLHRAILGLEQGDGLFADHINRNKLDNRKSNLRICDRSVNARNNGRAMPSSGFRNVYWNGFYQRWTVEVYFRCDRFERNYRTKEEAIAVAAALRSFIDMTEPKAVGA